MKNVFLFVLAMILAAGLCTARHGVADNTIIINGRVISGAQEGPVKTEARKTQSYSRVRLEAGGVDMDYTVSSAPSLTVAAPEELLQRLTTEVVDGQLVVKLTGTVIITKPLRITAAGPSLDAVEIAGSGNFKASGLAGPSLRLVISGSGDVAVSGGSEKLEATVAGSGSVDAAELRAKEAEVTISGSGDVRAYASETARVKVSGSGAVHISGNPKNRTVDKTGSGEVSF